MSLPAGRFFLTHAITLLSCDALTSNLAWIMSIGLAIVHENFTEVDSSVTKLLGLKSQEVFFLAPDVIKFQVPVSIVSSVSSCVCERCVKVKEYVGDKQDRLHMEKRMRKQC